MRQMSVITSRYMTRLMASKANRQLFGETEFLLRDAVHRPGGRGHRHCSSRA